jgi:hypothetical protein
MKRKTLLGLCAMVIALAALPATAMAGVLSPTGNVAQTAEQLGPPPIPMTAYGTASGATIGGGVIAIVTVGSVQTVCGVGLVVSDAGSAVYVVDVLADGQRPGCGTTGRTVSFYFTPGTPGGTGRLAQQTTQWQMSFKNVNLTLGPELTNKGFVPQVAKDGVW